MLIATYPKGEERAASIRLTQLWKSIKQEDIFIDWGFPYLVSGFFSKPSFFDSSPERATVEKFFTERQRKLYRRFSVGIADAQDGSYVVVNDTTGVDKLPLYLTGSSAVPGVFKYIVDPPHVYIDGGTLNSLNLRGGIAACQEEFGVDTDVTIDIVITNPCMLT
jgi:predicted acylesterase/phospholipase RssA